MDSDVINDESRQLMWTSQQTADGKKTPHGLGFGIFRSNCVLRVSHNGSQEKTPTRMVFYPEQRHGIVVMSNSEHANPGRISTAIYRALNLVAGRRDKEVKTPSS